MMRKEFFAGASFGSIEQAQRDLDAWVAHYNRPRGGLGPAPRRIGPTWAQFLRAQAFATLATGGAPGSDHEDRGRRGQARTPPAWDSGDRPSLQKECPRATLLPLLPQSVLPSEVWSTRDGIDQSRCWLRGRYPLAARALATDRPPLSFLLPIRVTERSGWLAYAHRA